MVRLVEERVTGVGLWLSSDWREIVFEETMRFRKTVSVVAVVATLLVLPYLFMSFTNPVDQLLCRAFPSVKFPNNSDASKSVPEQARLLALLIRHVQLADLTCAQIVLIMFLSPHTSRCLTCFFAACTREFRQLRQPLTIWQRYSTPLSRNLTLTKPCQMFWISRPFPNRQVPLSMAWKLCYRALQLQTRQWL